MMSLHGLASGVISSINPMMQCQLKKYAGLITAPGGFQSPSYLPTVTVTAQVQQLTAADLKHLNDMNVAGVTRKVWCDTQLSSVSRAGQLGGDILVLPDGTTWLVVHVVESWPDWCSVLLQQQVS